MTLSRNALLLAALAACILPGCVDERVVARKDTAPAAPAPMAVTKVSLGKNVFLEKEGDKRRVLVQAYVCLRAGPLEQLLTRKNAKEHEAVLAADVDARAIHAALMAAGAEPGKPVQFRPKFQPPTGTVIKIRLLYDEKGKRIEVPARSWVRDRKTGGDLDHDWVFSGSQLMGDAKTPFYAANDGDVICVTNFETALLDLAVQTSKDYGDLSFEAYTERIPPLATPVLIVLEPALKTAPPTHPH